MISAITAACPAEIFPRIAPVKSRTGAACSAAAFPGHEAQESFCLAIDRDTIEMLKETGPETFYQTSHYAGYDAVLVRYDSPDDERVKETIARSRDWTAARPKARARRKKG